MVALLTVPTSRAALVTWVVALAGIATAVVMSVIAYGGFLRRDRWLGRVRAGGYPTLRVRPLTHAEQIDIATREIFPYGDWEVLALHDEPNAAVERGVFEQAPYRSGPHAPVTVTFVKM